MPAKTIRHLVYSHSVYICFATKVFSQTDGSWHFNFTFQKNFFEKNEPDISFIFTIFYYGAIQ